MIIKDIEYKLKDGRNALIRSPQDEDKKVIDWNPDYVIYNFKEIFEILD